MHQPTLRDVSSFSFCSTAAMQCRAMNEVPQRVTRCLPMLVKLTRCRAMTGRVVTTFLAICLSSGVCFSQIYTLPPDSFGTRSNSLDQMQLASISGVVVGSDGAPI